MERYDSAGGGGLSESDVRNNAAPAQHGDPSVPPLGKAGNAVDDVAAAADFQHVAPERVGRLLSDDYRGFGFVLRAGWSASGPAVAGARLEAVVAARARVLIVAFSIVVPAVLVVLVLLRGSGVWVAGAAVSGCGVGVGVGVGVFGFGVSRGDRVYMNISSPPSIRHGNPNRKKLASCTLFRLKTSSKRS